MLQDHETIKQLGHILKTNVRACMAVGHPFVTQLGRVYLDMLNVYKVLSENISSAVALNGQSHSHACTLLHVCVRVSTHVCIRTCTYMCVTIMASLNKYMCLYDMN